VGVVTLLRRLILVVAAIAVFTLVSLQFAHIVNENVAMAGSLSSVQQDISALKERRRIEEREIRRLSDPEGAVPEIHDRLRLTRPDEALIYVKPAPTQPPQ
jgi:cell division protein FtsB